ncbi:MAG: hypothetical protein JNL69_10410 [Bacteroidia bacterium]|nr:hypothetical protein [Bacteroidia bacterium]
MQLSFQVNKNINQVVEYLSNMQKFASVHPVISHIDDKGNNNYLVHETLKLGFIPFSFTYPVTIEISDLNKRIFYRATVFKFTTVEMKFELKSNNGFTIVEEDIQFKSIFPVKFIMQKIFKKQHTQLFKNIELQ